MPDTSGPFNVILIQLGSPQSPEPRDVRAYLKQFLGDPRVLDMHPLARALLLHGVILPFRPFKVARAYRRIWFEGTFPLVAYTESLVRKLNHHLTQGGRVYGGYLIGQPDMAAILRRIEGEGRKGYPTLVIPQFPQYSSATTASVEDAMIAAARQLSWPDSLTLVPSFHQTRAFIGHSVRQIEEHVSDLRVQGISLDTLILSFHGLPKKRILERNDPYFRHCRETANLIGSHLQSVDPSRIQVTFQSRFGADEWLEPNTEDWVLERIRQGGRHFAVYCPSFVVDCLETLDEIGHELRQKALAEGAIHFSLVPCLNDGDDWAKDYARWMEHLPGSETETAEVYNYPPAELELPIEEPVMRAVPFTKSQRVVMKVVLLSLFLDIAGFSIIFPMFPALADYYIARDPQDPCLLLVRWICRLFTDLGGAGQQVVPLVLFGGVLGSIYAFLQFLFTPFWGSLSDRIGRKPVLLVSIVGLGLSHLLWIFSGSFTLFFVSRILGGMMGGKISTATAVIADITHTSSRSRGMALAGMTLGLGFVLGPAIGGILCMVDFTRWMPALEGYGIHPFSAPALLAFILSVYNIWLVMGKFDETFPPSRRIPHHPILFGNPFLVFRKLPYPGVNLTNMAYFFFLIAYGGMEFTLTFLAAERLAYTPTQNAGMFVFAGLLIALTQGILVRRFAHWIGEKRMILAGLLLMVPGFITLGLAASTTGLFAGLFLVSVAGGMTMPCYTSLVSLLSPPGRQGALLGRFRALGALARVFGPFFACFAYWHFSPAGAYFLGAVFLLIPLALTWGIPKPPYSEPAQS